MIPLGQNDWETQLSDISIRIKLRNMYLISNPFSPDGVTRVSRPSLSLFKMVSNQSIYGIWQQYGTFDSDMFIVAGEILYRYDNIDTLTELGPLPGTDYCQFAGIVDRVVITRNGVAYSYDGTTLTTILLPDDRLAGSVATIDSVFLISVQESQRFYWINPGETDPDPLSFATAERTPDPIISINILSDEIWFIGSTSVEVWQTTGDLDSPYQRIPGRVYTEGCIDKSTTATSSYEGRPCLFWVTDKKAVVMAQGSTQKISNESVEEVLRRSQSYRAWSFRLRRHDFYVLTTEENTFVYDVAQKTWSRWDTYGKLNWQAHLGVQIGDRVLAGDSEQGLIWELVEGDRDGENLPIVREVSGFVPCTDKGLSCSSVNVRINAGWPPEYTGTPVLEMRWSDDYGYSWTEYFPCKMGKKGNYEYDVTYRSLGDFTRPGREFEFRFSDIAKFRIDYATMNEV